MIAATVTLGFQRTVMTLMVCPRAASGAPRDCVSFTGCAHSEMLQEAPMPIGVPLRALAQQVLQTLEELSSWL